MTGRIRLSLPRILRGLGPGACVVVLSLVGGCGGFSATKAPTERDVARRAARHLQVIRAQSPVPLGPLTFEDAVARALAFNLDLRVAALEEAVARGNVDLADLDKLPDLLLTAGYTHRDKPAGFASDGGRGQRVKLARSAELSWDVLDFGIAYLRSLQAEDALAIQRETRRRMANQIINDVRTAYWTVVLGRRRLADSAGIQRDLESAQKVAERLAALGLQDPLVGLNYRDGLIDLKRQIRTYQVELEAAEGQLGRLLNLHPRQRIDVAPGDPPPDHEALLDYDRGGLEEAALMLRSELREADHTLRSRRLDILRAYVQMVPSLRLRWGSLYDNTSTLAANHWSEAGFNTSLSLLNLASMVLRARQARDGAAVADLRRLSISLAILEQVGTSQERLRALAADHALAREAAAVRREIHEKRMNRLPTDVGEELERARAAVAALSTQLREDRAYTTLQTAYGNLLSAIGIDQFPEPVSLEDPKAAAARLHDHLGRVLPQVRLAMAKVAVLGRPPETLAPAVSPP
ncbi:MAG: TolC family protein [Burkholderiales bacterium]